MTPPIIYNADPVTGEFIGTSYADPDPLTPGNWLLPAHAYLEAPPAAGSAECAAWDGERWTLMPDMRGECYSTETGWPVQHLALGPLPDGLTAEAPESDLHRWDGSRWILNPALVAARRRLEIMAELYAIDAASARPLRAILVAGGGDEDRAKLAELDAKATALRAELATLPAEELPPA